MRADSIVMEEYKRVIVQSSFLLQTIKHRRQGKHLILGNLNLAEG